MDFIWPVAPAPQPVRDNRAGKCWAVFVPSNGFISQIYLCCCPYGDRYFQDSARQGGPQGYAQFVDFVTAIFRLVLVLGQMIALSKTVFTTQAYVTVARSPRLGSCSLG
uniref:Uncharacterized protein n=1 Tax=Leersia perrieri TaxID=77586 RepID=A0A0D9X8K8_9ORYZ